MYDKIHYKKKKKKYDQKKKDFITESNSALG